MKVFTGNTIGGIFKNTFVQIGLIIWVFLQLLPLGWVLMSSFKKDTAILMTPFAFPKSFYLGNYDFKEFAENDIFVGLYYRNSVMLVVITLAILIFISLLAGYSIGKLRLPGKNIILVILVGMIAVPIHALIIPLFYFFADMGLISNLFSVVLPLVAINTPFSIILLQAYFKEFPDELIESAKIDGCNTFTAFIKVVLPCSINSVSAVLVINFLAIWNDFFIALIMLKRNSVRTLPLGMASFIGEYFVNYGSLFAAVILSVVPTILIFVIFSRYIISGLTRGSIKG